MHTPTLLSVGVGAAALTLGLGIAAAADPVASFVRIDGHALVSKGAKYVEAHADMRLFEGERLLVLEGGKAILRFSDGCVYEVADNEIVTIGATSTCAWGGSATRISRADPYPAVSRDPSVAARSFTPAAAGMPPAPRASLIAAGMVSSVVIAGAAGAFDRGSDDDLGPTISP